jgi:Flp pilus assembly protein TadG
MNRPRSTDRIQRGTVLVEQALTVTFLCSIMFGIVECGRMLYAYHFVSSAARDASRWASVRSQTSNLGHAGHGNIQTLVQPPNGMGLDPAQVTATINWVPPQNNTPLCPAAGLPSDKPGCMVSVQVQYVYQFTLPLVRAGTITMQSTSETLITQ